MSSHTQYFLFSLHLSWFTVTPPPPAVRLPQTQRDWNEFRVNWSLLSPLSAPISGHMTVSTAISWVCGSLLSSVCSLSLSVVYLTCCRRILFCKVATKRAYYLFPHFLKPKKYRDSVDIFKCHICLTNSPRNSRNLLEVQRVRAGGKTTKLCAISHQDIPTQTLCCQPDPNWAQLTQHQIDFQPTSLNFRTSWFFFASLVCLTADLSHWVSAEPNKGVFFCCFF